MAWTYTSNTYGGRYLQLTIAETVNQVDNTSTLNWTLTSTGGTSNYYTIAPTTITINGTQVYYKAETSFTAQVFPAAKGSASGSITVAHDADGAKTGVTVSFTTRVYLSGAVEYAGTTIDLTPIPRASTIGATDANIGSVSMIAVSKKTAAYTHSIAYKFGTLSGYITASGGVSSTEVKFSDTSVAFTVPTTFYAQIPSAKSGTCTLTVKTYSGTSQIGSAQTCTFTATAAESACKPTVSGTVVDNNATTVALTGSSAKLVRYYSNALCTITATAKNSASITAKTIGGTAVSTTTRTITGVESGSVVFAATDSRGYSASATVAASMVAYVKLTNNASAARTDPTSGNAALTIKGDYFNGSFGAVSNTLSVKYRIGTGSYVTVTPTLSGNTYSASVALTGLTYTQSYTLEVVVADKLATVTKTVTVGQGVPVFDWGQNDFAFHVPVTMDGVVVGIKTASTTVAIGGLSVPVSFVKWGKVVTMSLCLVAQTAMTTTTGGAMINIPSGFEPHSALVAVDMTTTALWGRGSYNPTLIGGLSIHDVNNIRVYWSGAYIGYNWTIGATMTWITP